MLDLTVIEKLLQEVNEPTESYTELKIQLSDFELPE